jgi:hypothetical protein
MTPFIGFQIRPRPPPELRTDRESGLARGRKYATTMLHSALLNNPHPTMTRLAATVIVILLVVAGCSDEGAPAEAPTSSANETSSPPTANQVFVPPTSNQAFVPPTPALVTPPDLLDQLGPYAEIVLGGGAVLPGSPEHFDYLVSCMESAGFAVTLDVSSGSISGDPGADQMDRFRDTLAICDEAAFESGLVARHAEQTPDELRLWYRAFLLAHECLTEHGYPASDPPSIDVYVESGGTAWHPYDALSPASIQDIEPICPQDLIVLISELAQQDP